jgi:2-dehydro-3-deoxygluconokinase
MSRYVTLGEIMLRLKAPAHERFLQTAAFEATFGGAEANVAVSLAQFGLDAAFVTALPANAIGDAALAELRRFGVDVSGVVRHGRRIGIYYLETGSGQRPSEVVYDRAGSAFAETETAAYDWDAIFANAGWLHISGITPALSATAADLAREACRRGRERGLTISCDLNYRSKLWNYGRQAPDVMTGIFRLVDVGIAGRGDCRQALGIDAGVEVSAGEADTAAFETLTATVMGEFPNLSTLAITIRDSQSADRNGWSACLRQGDRFCVGPRYELTRIVDRVGAGDAFSAGLIYGLGRYADAANALGFATAAGCLKHSVSGDFNRVSIAEVESLASGDASGRIRR